MIKENEWDKVARIVEEMMSRIDEVIDESTDDISDIIDFRVSLQRILAEFGILA